MEIFGLVSLIRLQIGKEAQKTLPFNSKTKHFYTTLVASGKSFKEIIEDYPEVEENDINQALEFAVWATSKKATPIKT